MDIKKPQTFNPHLEGALQELKIELNGEHVLDQFAEEHHDKIVKDYLEFLVLFSQLPEDDNSNPILPEFKLSLVAGYFTIIPLSKHTLDANDYIDKFMVFFKNMMEEESLSGIAIRAAISLQQPEIMHQIMSLEVLGFLDTYSIENWPDAVNAINNMNDEERKNFLNEIIYNG